MSTSVTRVLRDRSHYQPDRMFDWPGRLVLCLVLALLVFCSLTSPANLVYADQTVTDTETSGSVAAEDPFGFGVLWRIENGRSDPSFLFGTMHVEDPRVTDLPPPVDQAFEQSASLTTEAMLDMEHILQVGPKLVLTDGTTLRGLVGEEIYEDVRRALSARGMIPDMAALLKPWAASMLLSQPLPQTGEFLDKKLYDRAQRKAKPVYGLETLTEQVDIFDRLSLSEQVALLEETLAEVETMDDLVEQLTAAYLARDLARLNTLADDQFDGSPLQQRLKQDLLIDRNARMADRMIDRLEEGNAFIAIGALHLPGRSGVLNLLQQRGYSIQRAH